MADCFKNDEFEIIELRVSRSQSANVDGMWQEVRQYRVKSLVDNPSVPLWPSTWGALPVSFPVVRPDGSTCCWQPTLGAPYPAEQVTEDPAMGILYVIKQDAEFAPGTMRALNVTITLGSISDPLNAEWSADLSLIGEQTSRDIFGDLIRVNEKTRSVERLRPQFMFSARQLLVRTDELFWSSVKGAIGTVNEAVWTPARVVPLPGTSTCNEAPGEPGAGDLTFDPCTLLYHGCTVAPTDSRHGNVDHLFQEDKLGHTKLVEQIGPDGKILFVKKVCLYEPANWTSLQLGDMEPAESPCCLPGAIEGEEEIDMPPLQTSSPRGLARVATGTPLS